MWCNSPPPSLKLNTIVSVLQNTSKPWRSHGAVGLNWAVTWLLQTRRKSHKSPSNSGLWTRRVSNKWAAGIRKVSSLVKSLTSYSKHINFFKWHMTLLILPWGHPDAFQWKSKHCTVYSSLCSINFFFFLARYYHCYKLVTTKVKAFWWCRITSSENQQHTSHRVELLLWLLQITDQHSWSLFQGFHSICTADNYLGKY